MNTAATAVTTTTTTAENNYSTNFASFEKFDSWVNFSSHEKKLMKRKFWWEARRMVLTSEDSHRSMSDPVRDAGTVTSEPDAGKRGRTADVSGQLQHKEFIFSLSLSGCKLGNLLFRPVPFLWDKQQHEQQQQHRQQHQQQQNDKRHLFNEPLMALTNEQGLYCSLCCKNENVCFGPFCSLIE